MPFFQGEQEAEMQKEVLKEPTYVEELLTLFRSNLGKEELLEKISDYHESDIADAMEQMTPEERKKLYPLLGEEYIAEILSYTEDAAEYLQEINLENAARVISEMDSDDAVDVLENLDADTKTRIVDLLDDDAEKDVKLILSYEDDEIGSKMTTNFIVIGKNLNIRQATHELIRQAGENDNISTIYVVDENGNLYNYIEDGVGYDTACCELDANNEAMRTMLSYSEEFGSDPEYLNYLEERKNHFQDVNETLKEEREQRQEIQKEQAEKAYYRGDLSEEEYTEIKEHVEENRMDRMEKDSPYIENSLDYTKEHCEESVGQELRERMTDSKEKFESEIYKKHPDKQKLNELRQDNNQNLEYIKQQQQRYNSKENEKFDEIQKYVNENNLTPRECQNDEKYQEMLNEYSTAKEENASLRYQKEVLEEQNKQIDEVITPKEEQEEKRLPQGEEQEEQGKNIARRMEEEPEQIVAETENEELGMEEIAGEDETEVESEEMETDSSAVDSSEGEDEDEEYTYSY